MNIRKQYLMGKLFFPPQLTDLHFFFSQEERRNEKREFLNVSEITLEAFFLLSCSSPLVIYSGCCCCLCVETSSKYGKGMKRRIDPFSLSLTPQGRWQMIFSSQLSQFWCSSFVLWTHLFICCLKTSLSCHIWCKPRWSVCLHGWFVSLILSRSLLIARTMRWKCHGVNINFRSTIVTSFPQHTFFPSRIIALTSEFAAKKNVGKLRDILEVEKGVAFTWKCKTNGKKFMHSTKTARTGCKGFKPCYSFGGEKLNSQQSTFDFSASETIIGLRD